jgi:D-alanyl-D-alanine dipeptidase
MMHPLVHLHQGTHDLVVELVYATPFNVSGQAIYARPLCLIHRDAEVCLREAMRLAAVMGLRLKIFDAFRPEEAQWRLWETAPDPAYVADPRLGSNHTRGIAVDLTLVNAQDEELDMGTGFDDMTVLSHHFNEQVSPVAQANRLMLLQVMQGAGFEPIPHEWWHYALPNHAQFPLLNSSRLGPLNPMHPA